ncbi:hypothetical protein [Flavobacterium litorale]|uniref:Uncharacterized protein n=1 Tax=Flavobacterium litorale TaxID=2856519 RepID=A0ABX8V5X0_9FLAO|nr:hypothetical protein [Flavobacterium litorale]QYJ68234.1 hypothetical protein K1I41_12010 [Flavobacterium litorale]
MNTIIKKYTDAFFGALITKFNFNVKNEMISDESYLVEYASENYVIRIEKYNREFYPTVYSINDLDNKINFFNLAGFLNQSDSNTPKSEFFRKEKEIEECYKKQLNHISNAIYSHLHLLDYFFSEDKYNKNVLKFHRYWKNKHPELYKTL